MAPLMRLPSYQMPDNALLNFAPVNQAFAAKRQSDEQDRQYGIQQDQLGLQRQAAGLQQSKFDWEQRKAKIDQVGALASAADQATDPRQRAILLNRAISLHPDYASGKLDPVYSDPVNGPKILAAEAGHARDALEAERQRLAIDAQRQQYEQAKTEGPLRVDLLKAQTSQANQRDELGQAKASILRNFLPQLIGTPGQGGGAPSAGPAQPRLQPQSFESGATGVPGTTMDQDPNFIRTQAAAPDQPAPQRPPGILDNLTPGQRAGVALGMAGMGDVGKIVADSDPTKLGKDARTEVDKGQLQAVNQIGRLTSLQQGFKPEYLQIEPRLGFAWNDLMSKFQNGKIAPEQTRKLQEYASWRADAADNINRYIKEITGAQMGEAEAARLMRAMPNPGTGIFDGDSPPTFKAKMDTVIRNAKLAQARFTYLRQNGFTGDAEAAARSVPLESVPQIYNQRGNELLKQLQQQMPKVAPQQLMPLVEQRLKKEFGVDI